MFEFDFPTGQERRNQNPEIEAAGRKAVQHDNNGFGRIADAGIEDLHRLSLVFRQSGSPGEIASRRSPLFRRVRSLRIRAHDAQIARRSPTLLSADLPMTEAASLQECSTTPSDLRSKRGMRIPAADHRAK
jgi:hypothetical protein